MESPERILKKILSDNKPSSQSNTDCQAGIQPESDHNLAVKDSPACSLCGDRGIILNGDSAVPCMCMENKKIENSFKYARLSKELMQCRFEAFNLNYYLGDPADKENYVNAQKALKAAQAFTTNVLDNPNEVGLLFTGPVGCGKTYLAASIANVLIEKHLKVLFLVVPDLLDELRASFNNKNAELTEFDLLDLARTIPVLILDDLGAHNYTEWARNRLYSILNYRTNEQLPTIITTNLSFAEIEQHLGERTCSRLVQMCRLFRLSVDTDIRMQKYLKREGLK